MSSHRWEPVCRPPRGLVAPVTVDPTGVAGPTRGQSRGPRWRRTSRGLYVPTAVADLPEQRILEQSMRLPAVGAVTGWAACRLHGAAFFDGLAPDGVTRLPVPLAVGPGGCIRPVDGVLLTFDRLPAHDVVRRQGIPVVDAARAVFDAARLAGDVREAVVAIDMAIVGRITSVERMAAYTRQHHDQGITGIGQVREALPLARERSWSPNESRLRLIGEIDAGLPRLEPTCPVLDRGGTLLGIADLSWNPWQAWPSSSTVPIIAAGPATPGTWPRTSRSVVTASRSPGSLAPICATATWWCAGSSRRGPGRASSSPTYAVG